MKNYLLLVLFACTTNAFSQINSGKVTYNVKKTTVNFIKDNNQPKEFKEFANKIDNIITTLEFVLEFNHTKSMFYMKKQMDNDYSEFNTKMAVLSTRGNSTFYVDLDSKIILEQSNFLGNDVLIKSLATDLKWQITKEKKQIGNYECYKAVAKKENTGPLKNDFKYFNYTAWFCPELSYSFGPQEITALPGLILEFSNGRLTYYVKSIEFSEDSLKVKIPSKGKVISKSEYERLGREAYENSRSFED